MIGQGLAKFTERRDNTKRSVKLPGEEFYYYYFLLQTREFMTF